MRFEYNKDDKRRCEILGFTPNYMGGYSGFGAINIDQLNTLLEEKFIDPDECQNCSPSTMVFKEFMEKYPGVTAHGYIIGPDRIDYRVTIEGLEYDGDFSREMMEDFVDMFRHADDFIFNNRYLFCWYD